jgi:hypothetical protein
VGVSRTRPLFSGRASPILLYLSLLSISFPQQLHHQHHHHESHTQIRIVERQQVVGEKRKKEVIPCRLHAFIHIIERGKEE